MITLRNFLKNQYLLKWVVIFLRRVPQGQYLLWKKSFEFVNPGRWSEKRKGVIRVLLSGESDNRYDLLKTVTDFDGRELEYIFMPSRIFNELYDQHMSQHRDPDALDNSKPYNHKGVDYLSSLASLHQDLRRALRWIKKSIDPDIFISASLGDARWKHICKIAREETGVPWLVTEREGVISKLSLEEGPLMVAHEWSPHVDFMITSNEAHALRWQRSGIPRKAIAIVGDLKSDFWRQENDFFETGSQITLSSNEKMVLMFCYGDRNYINSKDLPPERHNWRALRGETFEVLAEVIAETTEAKLVLKGGHAGDLPNEIQGCFGELIASGDALLLDSRFPAIPLIQQASVVIGMQTTALIEAQFTNVPIIYAGWGAVHDSVYNEYLLPIKEGDVKTPSSKDEFREILRAILETGLPPDSEKRRHFRERFFFQPDGMVHQRVAECIVSICDHGELPEKWRA